MKENLNCSNVNTFYNNHSNQSAVGRQSRQPANAGTKDQQH